MKNTITLLSILFAFSFLKAQDLKLFKDVKFGPQGSNPYLFSNSETLYYLSWSDGIDGRNSLWMSDGVDSSETGTKIITRLGNGSFSGISEPVFVNDKFFFFYQDSQTPYQLFVSDGTSGGTKSLQDLSYRSMVYSGVRLSIKSNNNFIFQAETEADGLELWVSDGTEPGTFMLKDINKNGHSAPIDFIDFNNQIYFSAVDTLKNRCLWKTDGTENGTVLVKDFSKNGGILNSILGIYNGKLYLNASDSVNGSELWVSDGTEVGTVFLKDINKSGDSYPYYFSTFKNKMYFTADDGIHGKEIWTSDGTELGTKLFIDINKSSDKRYTTQFCSTTDLLYFNAYDETNGFELWKTDGSEVGTNMVKNIVANKDDSPLNFTSIDNLLFFTANAGNIGNEIYMTDGTEAGTKILEPTNRTEINPIIRNPFFVFKDKLYVVGDYEADYGTEIYVYDPKENTSGIRTFSQNNSHVFPNPTTDEIQIKNNDFSLLEIYDMSGKLLLKTEDFNQKTKVDFLAAGMYLLKLSNNKTQVSERFIKQ